MKTMNTITRLIIALLITAMVFTAGCAPLSAEETEREREMYAQKYADESEPKGDIAKLLDFLDTCVGGKYVFGGQGHAITDEFIDATLKLYPKYLDGGRLEYLREIAAQAQRHGHRFPEDYAWDCSGLWWYAVNELGFYAEYTDRTAQDTYNDYCTPIKKDELRPGDIVFVAEPGGKIVHMGIVGRHGHIYEAVSGFSGVVYKRTIDKRVYVDNVRGGVVQNRNWNRFGRPKIFE